MWTQVYCQYKFLWCLNLYFCWNASLRNLANACWVNPCWVIR
jgi:hypothetical protein